MIARWLLAAAVLFLSAGARAGAAADLPVGQREPLLRVDGNGPTSSVTALAFSPDGQTLYAAGYDKIVRVWQLDKKTGQFVLDGATYRVIVGPGLAGAINSIAVSTDGAWLALGGLGVVRGGTDFRSPGFVFPQAGAMDDTMREDQGMIYVYETGSTGARLPETHLLRGHRGPVLATCFVPAGKGPLLLLSAGLEWNEKANAFGGVVRLWDVRKETCLATLSRGLPRQNLQPGLAVWRVGNKPDQLRAAIAWGDSSLRVWDVERGAKGLVTVSDGPSNTAVAYVPGARPRLITTSFRAPQGRMRKYHGQIQAWSAPDEAGEKPAEASGHAVLSRPLGEAGKPVYFLPKLLVPFSSQGNGKLDRAAVLFRLSSLGQKDHLQIIDLDPGDEKFGEVKAEVPLWAPGDAAPVLAAAPNGGHVAIAGRKDHGIVVYSVPDLLNNTVKSQTLQSVGVTVGAVTFVAKGAATGLRLVAGKGRQRTVLLFDLAHRALIAEEDGWKNAGPEDKEWTVDLQTRLDQDGKQWQQIVVKRQDNATGQPIPLKTSQRVTSHALLPPMKPLNTPILALAYLDFESGEPALALYDVATGSRIRQLAGHVDPIRGLAFSADGRLLASAADDQTVCLWSMANLEQVLGERGMLPDLAVVKGEGGVIVKQVKPTSPAFGKLEIGDLIEGLVLPDDAFQPLGSPRTFYETMWQQKPGATIALRVKGKGTVRLRVGQGIDERNPLLSLFITRGDQVQDQEWIAWSPLGYYDASAPKAERHLVWHFNKGKHDEPTATALTGQFRQEYWRQGLLKFLGARASLGGALEDWKKEQDRKNRPKPSLMMWIDEVGPDPKKRDERGRVPVRSKRVTLKLAIADFPFDDTDTVEWQWEKGDWQKFQKHAGSEWAQDLSALPWKRGANRLRAVLRTNGEGPQRFSEELVVSYQPAPPQVKFKGLRRQVVQEPAFTLQADVVPGPESPDVDVTLSQKHEGKELLAAGQRSAGLEVNKRLTLKPGLNLIALTARNKGALKGAEDKETAVLTLEVIYTKKDAPPRITLQVEALPNGAKTRVTAGETIVVTSPRVRLTGTIEAQGKITLAEWRNEKGKRVRLSGFADTEDKSFAIDEVLVLEPSVKPIEARFFAKTSSSDEAEATGRIAYHPDLPRISLTGPADQLVFYEGEDKPTVKVEGKLAWPDDPHPCEAQVIVNGKAAPATTLNKAAADYSDNAALAPGDNRIQVRFTNAWKKTATTEAILVRYLRPPRIEIMAEKRPLVSKKPLITVVARIHSAVPVKAVRAEINGPSGRHVVAAKLVPPADKEDAAAWRVQLNDVSLEPGKNELVLHATNVEASSRKPASLTIVYEPPPKPPVPPQVELVYPATDVKVTKAELEVRARIKSEGPLKRVDLIREGRAPARISLDLTDARRSPQGFYEVAARIKLVPQENVLRLEAVNAGGGRQSTPIAVSYIPQRPVRVEIQHLLVKGSTATVAPFKSTADRSVHFGAVANAKVKVVGRVTWDPESDALLVRDHQIDLYVNGLRQLPAELEPASGKERARSFTAEISLTRPQDNVLQVDLPTELKRNADNLPRYVVDCKKPASKQRVYLLPISVGEKDEKKFLKQMFDVLQARDVSSDQDRFSTPVFAEGRLYGPLTGYVNRRQVLTQLNRIKQEMIDQKKIDLRNPADAPTDVLLLYFRGGDSVASGRYELRTSDRQVAVSRDQLLKEFGETLGAQILLLDVDRQGAAEGDAADRLARWPDDARASLFRSAWLDPKGPRNAEPFLLDALAEALRRAGKLGEVATELKRKLQGTGKPKSKLAFDEYYPDPLADLLLGSKK